MGQRRAPRSGAVISVNAHDMHRCECPHSSSTALHALAKQMEHVSHGCGDLSTGLGCGDSGTASAGGCMTTTTASSRLLSGDAMGTCADGLPAFGDGHATTAGGGGRRSMAAEATGVDASGTECTPLLSRAGADDPRCASTTSEPPSPLAAAPGAG